MSLQNFQLHITEITNIKGAPKNITENVFVYTTEIIENTTVIMWNINSQFFILNYISTCSKINLLLINSIYLVVFSIELQRTLVQAKVYYKFFLLCPNWNKSRTAKSSSGEKRFYPLCILQTQLFLINVFYSMS